MKELARYVQTKVLEALDAYSLALFTRQLGWSLERIEMLLAGVRQEIFDQSLRLYMKLYYVYGQKPETS